MLMAKDPKTPVDKVGRRNTIILFLCIIAVFATIIWILVRPFVRSNYDRRYRTIDNIPTPTQILTSGSQDLEKENWRGTAIYRAKYDIQGLVINAAKYNGDTFYDRISPLDIGLAWGDTAQNNHLIKWTRGHRFVTASVNALYKMYINKSTSTLFQQYSNNHLIFIDDDLLQKAQNVQLGDYIRIKGYLVDIEGHKISEPAIKYDFKTSLTRNDDGEESCEIILVTNLEFID